MSEEAENSDLKTLTKSLLDVAVESWRFGRLFDRLLLKLDAGEQARYRAQLRWHSKKTLSLAYALCASQRIIPTYFIDNSYKKPVGDVTIGLPLSAPTRDIGRTGTHGGNAGHILAFVFQYVDEFSDEYLRVNASACKYARGARL